MSIAHLSVPHLRIGPHHSVPVSHAGAFIGHF
jgi:hypothetical protein